MANDAREAKRKWATSAPNQVGLSQEHHLKPAWVDEQVPFSVRQPPKLPRSCVAAHATAPHETQRRTTGCSGGAEGGGHGATAATAATASACCRRRPWRLQGVLGVPGDGRWPGARRRRGLGRGWSGALSTPLRASAPSRRSKCHRLCRAALSELSSVARSRLSKGTRLCTDFTCAATTRTLREEWLRALARWSTHARLASTRRCTVRARWVMYTCRTSTAMSSGEAERARSGGAVNERKKKLGVSNTPYDGGRWVTDGGWWVTDGGWWVTDGGWCVTDGGWCVTDGGWCVTDGGWWVTDGGWWLTDGGWCVTDGGWWVTDGGWWVTDGGWWVATKHQRVDAIVEKKKGERPYGTPWARLAGARGLGLPLLSKNVSCPHSRRLFSDGGGGGGGSSSDVEERRGGGGLESESVCPKKCDKIFPTANFVFSRDGHFGPGGGVPGGDPPHSYAILILPGGQGL